MKHENSGSDDDTAEMNPARSSTIKDEAASSTTSSPEHESNTRSSPRSPSSPASSGKRSVDNLNVKSEADSRNGHASPKKHSRPSRLGRSSSGKNPPRIAPLFDHLPDATVEANKLYTVIESCIYQNKYLGYTEHAMECDCAEEWDSSTRTNHACGEDSDCINRATKMECVGDCACGTDCQNQRFARRIYANVSVIQTEKKGHGLRTNVDLKHGDFVFEYIGEVIAEGAFRRRMIQYDDEGIKHFYFMSLSKGEFVDATRKGNLGRFCNHSCNPNCYVDKWVVGDKLRMGIFAERAIKAGEELVFNYNVDRYGANPQPCYCGESNCTGFIGGKTQTERATKLSAATIEALGIDEDFDAWDTTIAKRPKKKKATDDDEEYVDSIEAKRLDPDGVTKVMAALMQCKEKWIAVRLLQRLRRSDDEDVRHRIVKLHGYKIMNSQLSAWRDDENIVLQILEILDSFPRLTRNKIVDAKIDQTLEPLSKHPDDRVSTKAQHLLQVWSQLELAYRIPRKARDATGTTSKVDAIKFERRESAQQRKRSRSRSRSKSPPKGPALPSGPRSLQRPGGFVSRPGPPSFARGPPPLPKGWFQAQDEKGRPYFYTSSGSRQWARPTLPAEQATPVPSKQPSHQDDLNSIINKIVEDNEKLREAKNATPSTPEPSKRDKKQEKWRSLDEEKQRKLYENTLFPHISYVMSKYKHKIPKDDLKRFGKEIAKKLVTSDYKAGRVKDPTSIDEKQQKKVKVFCKEYFDKAYHKHKKHEEEKAARKEKKEGTIISTPAGVTPGQSPMIPMEYTPVKDEINDSEDIKMSDHEMESTTSASPTHHNGTLKRKRGSPSDIHGMKQEIDSLPASPAKKANIQIEFEGTSPPPPPPPPAPPAETPDRGNTPDEGMVTDIHADTNFKSRSMADVLAEAQREGEEEEDDDDDDDDNRDEAIENLDIKQEEIKVDEGISDARLDLRNPMVDGQQVVEKFKEEDRD